MPANNSVFEKIGKRFTTKGISQRVQTMSVSAIKEMALLALETPGSVSLAWGIPSFETPEFIREGLIKELRSNPEIGKYAPPPGLPSLKRTIAERMKRDKGVEVNPETEMVVTAGAMQALMMAWMAILEPGEEILLTSPGFSSHYEQIGLAGGIPVGVPLIENKGWKLDVAAFAKAITKKTKAIVVVNPSNPTGTLFPKEDLLALAELAQKHDLFIVTDDPYEFLVYDNRKAFHLFGVPSLRERIISCFSFSKEYAMTGWRAGWMVAAEGFMNQILKIQDSFVICAPTVSQVAAQIALEGPYGPTKEMVAEFAKRRDLICSRLDKLSDLFSYQKPSGSYYVFPKIVPEQYQNSVDFCVQLLREAKVVIVPGSGFGPTAEGHVRMSFSYGTEVINEAFDRIEKWWTRAKCDGK